MGRAPRPQGEDLTYHVTARGNNRSSIFEDERDRFTFLRLLEDTRRRRCWRVHAWCLMGNHIHVLVTTKGPDISAGVRDVLGGYARRYNSHHERSGHLFGRRFGSVLVTSDEQFLTTVRYINRNPVAAELVAASDDYPWSGYALRRSPRPPILLDEMVLRMLHPVVSTADRLLCELVDGEQRPGGASAPQPAIITLVQVMGERAATRAAARLGYRRREIATVLGRSLRTVDRYLQRV